MNLRFTPVVHELLQGACDIHIHSAPDLYPRIQNDVELARCAQEAGMRAILIKNHFTETAARAQVASQVTGFQVFGGIVLNHSVGGINPHAVEPALKMGAKVVWMPTLHAREFLTKKSHVKSLAGEIGADLEGVYLLQENGRLIDEVQAVLDLIIAHDSCLATGHISKPEARALVAEAARRGVKKIVVTHPMASFVNYSTDVMKELLDLGATWLEHVFNDTTRQVGHPITREALFTGIKAVGAERCIMSTDSGQWLNPIPAQQMGIYITDALDFGLSPAEVKKMVQDNPAAMLGLEQEHTS
ncbi:MAG: cytosolic protein [Proteobacteria bacterium]|nr:cytosolic protein [Pseudomonadota bacterium]